MTPNTQIDPELVAAAHAAAAQLGAAIMLGLSVLTILLLGVANAIGFRRGVSICVMVYGFVTFWIPAPLTMYLSPLIFLVGMIAFIVQTISRRIAKKRNAERTQNAPVALASAS